MSSSSTHLTLLYYHINMISTHPVCSPGCDSTGRGRHRPTWLRPYEPY
jgi:hypothetical protein